MNVLITGASRGVGFELAKKFLNEKHQVFAVSRNKDKLNKLALMGAAIIPFDLSSQDYQPLFSKIKNVQFDVLINNAGALVNKSFKDIYDKDLKYVYEVNLFSPFKLIRHLIPFFNVNAHVVNISSIGGVQGSVKFSGLSAYSSSKAALNVLTECLAEEFKNDSIRFNALALGAVQTEMLSEAFPEYRTNVMPSQIAEYIYNFSIDQNRLFNGKVIPISSRTP